LKIHSKCPKFRIFLNGFWTDNIENTSDAVKYKAFGKFEPKVLVWCAIFETGDTFIETIKGQAVDAEIYITKCLPKMVKLQRSTTKMTKQSFGPIWHRAIMQRKHWNGWCSKTSK
jgi:hypothetical protein